MIDCRHTAHSHMWCNFAAAAILQHVA